MNRWMIGLTILLVTLTACSPAASSTPSSPSTESVASLTPGRSPLSVTSTANLTPSEAPSPASTPPAVTDVYPLFPETSWTYTYSEYSQSPSDPLLTLSATLEIRETVTDLEIYPSFTLAHIQGNRSQVRADPDWQAFEFFSLGDYEYFYLLQDGSAYRSEVYPDTANIRTDQLQQEFQFPMVVGAEWCPSKLVQGILAPTAGTPIPCAYTGKRVVEQAAAYQTPAGYFEHCYQIRDIANNGSVIQWFCDGVGLVARKYDHIGSRFGFTQELTVFTPGSP